MAGALFDRFKVWVAETLTKADLNSEIQNIYDHFAPQWMDDYSSNVAQMQIQTSPGSQGSESQATSLAGEIERLRFQLDAIIGETYWYDVPDISLTEANSLINSIAGLPPNRIVSGLVRGGSDGSNQPVYLKPAGSGNGRTVDVEGASTPLTYRVAGTAYEVSTDETSGTLTAAPSTNNTAAVNDSNLAGQEYTKLIGEEGSTLTITSAGSEITALVGEFAGFKINNGVDDEYFIAFVKSSTELTQIRRGYFYDEIGSVIPRITISDTNTITLLKLTFLYMDKDQTTIRPVYTNPFIGPVQPTAPATGDTWLDTSLTTPIWKSYDGAMFNDFESTYIGIAVSDDTDTLAARSEDFHAEYKETNNIALEVNGVTAIRAVDLGSRISVAGNTIKFAETTPKWDITADLASGQSESASTRYYAYVKDNGDQILDETPPMTFKEKFGRYHPHEPWRYVGSAFNDASQDFVGSSSDAQNVAPNELFIRDRTQFDTAVGYISVFDSTELINNSTVTYVSDSTNGDRFIINESGFYSVYFKDRESGTGGDSNGVSVNGDVTATVTAAANYGKLMAFSGGINNNPAFFGGSGTKFLRAGDIVRHHTSGGSNPASTHTEFRIVKIG